MINRWKIHVKKVRKQYPKKSLKEILQIASGNYEKKEEAAGGWW